MAYPSPLQCSGPITMYEIRNWMKDAGELSSVTDQVSLAQLVAASHLADKTAPYQITDFYCYAILIATYGCGPTSRSMSITNFYYTGGTPDEYKVYFTVSNSGTIQLDLSTDEVGWYSWGVNIYYEGVLIFSDYNNFSTSKTVSFPFTYNTSNTITVQTFFSTS